ncbi:MAG: AMIN domain-containing protein [Oscillatoriales cyanobacterium]|uniref:AMIN domain-containing protein n=1 Tax=unclassified Microcoleus TaxID=2642155 RepID=UPI001DF9BD03|nr:MULTISPECIES: AMIN domain-containing protein [unclassified Microcoleus]TAG08061.1 MAG: AMIN domain-containing protein [Oscillatoriales cyanobacterium]MCC3433996.1 AMIN domain-containing protein [Microcoleus sp. PH2017_05_CCC_O_A]MCC3583539.1 AMIN domain-containing protein [Microcoleus sp. PH2017_30_WIL_O_A]TAG17508.1 MAG: AMIN domain-containing protein [Oscillatoriales cyanobacterium]TAG45611.1 MAG: AMIN domain-containing protein [Oscillatoriales cyanobacterium]
MKLYLPLACAALLSIGMGPTVAAEAAREDRAEASRSIALKPGPIERPGESEELLQPLPDSALGERSELSLKKSSIKSEKLETKQTAADPDRQPNPQLTQNIFNSDDHNTSIPNPPPFATGRSIPTTSIPKADEIEQPSTSAQGLLRPSVRSFTSLDDIVQISQSVVQVTDVRLNQTSRGLEIILETGGQQLQTTTRIQGNTAIVNIPNTVLQLPDGNEFRAQNPAEGITPIIVTQLDGNTIRVSVTGVNSIPTARINQNENTLILSISPEITNLE